MFINTTNGDVMQSLKFIVLVGISGSGKSTFEKRLSSEHPELFKKVVQVTTRAKRNNDVLNNSDYLFMGDDEFKHIKDILVGKTSLNGNSYGSLVDIFSDKIHTIILNKMGLESFIDDMGKFNNSGFDVDYRVLYLNRLDNDPTKLVGREGRNFDEEASVIEYADVSIDFTSDSPIDIDLLLTDTIGDLL